MRKGMGSSVGVGVVRRLHNKRLKLTPHVWVWGFSPVRRSLAALR